ncbi:MAG: IS1634 family transposase [Christensenellaceae bacterium]|nr:IS1634 family transposase [Christensenellaceae bacterium]
MHTFENKTIHSNANYCYICESKWDSSLKKSIKSSFIVGKITDGIFKPNNYMLDLLNKHLHNPVALNDHQKITINTLLEKYGDGILNNLDVPPKPKGIKTAKVIFFGPELVYGEITRKYNIVEKLTQSFGLELGQHILAVSWYLVCEGDALSNSDVWFEIFETPSKLPLSSQQISKMLELMTYDKIMTFYKLWLQEFSKSNESILYDLTSISSYSNNLTLVEPGYNRSHQSLPQVNFALLCIRKTGMPLYANPLQGSISDVSTLETLLKILDKLGYHPNCLMMDRGFGSSNNISYMLQKKQKFLQSLKINNNWIKTIIDNNYSNIRNHPKHIIIKKYGQKKRVYRAFTVKCQWVHQIETIKNDRIKESMFAVESNSKYLAPSSNITIKAQYPCFLHILFSHDLSCDHADKFIIELNQEAERLEADESATISDEYKKFLKISKPKCARKREINYDFDAIEKAQETYKGHVCFLTNDPSISTAKEALEEYSTRDYIEKDFDEMKNELDMKNLIVHTDENLRARLFVQFLSEIILRELKVTFKNNDLIENLTRKQISGALKGMHKITFANKYKDIYPKATKKQRLILNALNIKCKSLD